MPNCVNCGEQLNGKYCSNCGQKRIEKADKKLSHFLEEFFASLFFADGKLFRTFQKLFLNPGELGFAYVNGIRAKFLSPLQLFFFANLLYFLVPSFNTFNTSLNTQTKDFFYSEMAKEKVASHLNKTNMSYEEFEEIYEKNSTNNAKLLLIVLVILQAIALHLLFIKSKYYFIDSLALMSYLFGYLLITFFVFLPSFFLFLKMAFGLNPFEFMDELSVSMAIIFGILIYCYFLLKGSYDISPVYAFLSSAIMAILFFPIVLIYRFILFSVTYWMIT